MLLPPDSAQVTDRNTRVDRLTLLQLSHLAHRGQILRPRSNIPRPRTAPHGPVRPSASIAPEGVDLVAIVLDRLAEACDAAPIVLNCDQRRSESGCSVSGRVG